jgi:UDP:flavonoid glycosyltransferase YjiC (YdhE family)
VRGSVEALFAHARLLLDCLPEADPYGPRDGASYVGPLGAPATTHAVPWPEGSADAPRVFVYLRESELLRPALGALVRLRARVICVCPDARTDLLQGDCEHVRVVREPVPVAQVLADADAVLNYGSTTMVSQTLAAGRPQLMLPVDVEKWLVARRVAECGAGLMATVPDRIPQQLAQLFEKPFARRAREISGDWSSLDRRAIAARNLSALLEPCDFDASRPNP